MRFCLRTSCFILKCNSPLILGHLPCPSCVTCLIFLPDSWLFPPVPHYPHTYALHLSCNFPASSLHPGSLRRSIVHLSLSFLFHATVFLSCYCKVPFVSLKENFCLYVLWCNFKLIGNVNFHSILWRLPFWRSDLDFELFIYSVFSFIDSWFLSSLWSDFQVTVL